MTFNSKWFWMAFLWTILLFMLFGCKQEPKDCQFYPDVIERHRVYYTSLSGDGEC